MNFFKTFSFLAPVIIKKIITPKRLVLLLLLGFLSYLYISRTAKDTFSVPIGTFEKSSCPEFPKNGFFLSSNSLDNWNYIKKHPDYGCTGLIYVNNDPFDSKDGCKKPFLSGEIFLFPGVSCTNDNDCAICPNIKERPEINCKTNCPLIMNTKMRTTLHQQLVNLLSEDSSHFMGFSVKPNGKISYNSYTCNTQWFGKNEIGQCGGIDWQNKLKKFIEDKLK